MLAARSSVSARFAAGERPGYSRHKLEKNRGPDHVRPRWPALAPRRPLVFALLAQRCGLHRWRWGCCGGFDMVSMVISLARMVQLDTAG